MDARTARISDDKAIFQYFSRAFRDDPTPALRRLRERGTVFRSAASSDLWLTSYAGVSAVLRDKRFSVDSRNAKPQCRNEALPLNDACYRNDVGRPISKFFNSSMVYVDEPLHHKLRGFFSPLFSPSNMKIWKERIDAHVADLVKDMRAREEPDIIRDLALPLPVRSISELLGIPAEDAPVLQQWADMVSAGMQPVGSDEAIAAIDAAAHNALSYMSDHVDRMKRLPASDGLLNPFADTRGDDLLSSDELAASYLFLFGAGFETVVGGIGNGTLALLRHPDALNRLRASPDLVGNAVEELLRYDGPVRFSSRYALEDLEIEGVSVHRGDAVYLVLAAANRDPSMFPEPDQLDISRDAKHQLAFSQGRHFCLGAPLARLEIQSAIAAIANFRFSVIPGGTRWHESVLLRSLDELRITFD